MSNSSTDFKAVIAITNLSPLTKEMQNNLPDDYDKTQSAGNFALIYGTGYELESLKQTLQQAEANNYLYSPDTQEEDFQISGVGRYLVEFNCPFVTPPLNVSIIGSDFTDAYIESTSRFNMIVNVLTTSQDTMTYRATGFVGAASDENLGDGLYNNFGALYQFPRVGDSVIDDSYVRLYEKINTFVNVQDIIPVQTLLFDTYGIPHAVPTAPPIGVFYVKGIIRPTSAITSPQSTHELIDVSGNLIAMLDTSTTTVAVSSFYVTSPLNASRTDPSVYITGIPSTFSFNRWEQPSYIQEAFRGDNKYRRILSAINKSLHLGPTLAGASNMVEALVAQPFIPHEIWDDSDFRIFKNSIVDGKETTHPKYLTYGNDATGNIISVNSATQYETYPAVPPIIEIRRIVQSWSPDQITYNTKPQTISLEVPVKKQITTLNKATRFDLTNELTRSLRLGLNLSEGGIIHWNYQNTTTQIPPTGSPLYELYNYVFLNNAGDSIANINLFWYAQQTNVQGPTSYLTFGPLQYGRDYFAIPTNNFIVTDPVNGNTYSLPSDLLTGYAANSNIPYADGLSDIYGNLTWQGATLVSKNILPATLPALPPFLIQLDLRHFSVQNDGFLTKMPTNPYDFIIYSYAHVTATQANAQGSFPVTKEANGTGNVAAYYDADTSNAYQPIDSPFSTSNGILPPTALAQSSFAKIVSDTNYEYILTMVGGQITFNKTVFIDDVKLQAGVNDPLVPPAGIFIIQAIKVTPGFISTELTGQIGTNQYNLNGTVSSMISGNGNRFFQVDFGEYVLLNDFGYPIAIFDSSSLFNFSVLENQKVNITGVVFSMLWDTRIPIPVAGYRTGSPVFQATTNFETVVTPIATDISLTPNAPRYVNENFLVQINGLPAGNQQTVTGSWTFNILPTSAAQNVVQNSIAFSDFYNTVNGIQSKSYGIVSEFTGLSLLKNISTFNSVWNIAMPTISGIYQDQNNNAYYFDNPTSNIFGINIFNDGSMSYTGNFRALTLPQNTVLTYYPAAASVVIPLANYILKGFNALGLDPDAAVYKQQYVSPSFSGYFLNYDDYINVIGSKISSNGDANALNTLTNPVLKKPLPTDAHQNTVLNFFNPQFGFISLSILPGMEFYMTGSGAPVDMVRPNNNGMALQIDGDSYAGLTFYGSNTDKIVDKPTRLVVDFTYESTDQQVRKKIIEIEDGGYAGWVDGKYPDTTQTGSTFFITGNQFKYPHNGYDQALNQYSDNEPGKTILIGSPFYQRNPYADYPVVFETDPSQNGTPDLSDNVGVPGPPHRYRRAKLNNDLAGTYQTSDALAIQKGYFNLSPEKIAYLQFDLSSFPVDAIINNCVLEIYFCSGFTIKQGRDTNLELNKNISWQKSRLSGNGLTYQKQLTDSVIGNYNVVQPLGNVHWRKNFFEIVIPYAFMSEPDISTYGIESLFANSNANTLPAPVNPQPNLEYLGFLNIDEINTATLTPTNFIEVTVGLANIILSTSSIIFEVNGILSFGVNNSGTVLLNSFNANFDKLGNPVVPITDITQASNPTTLYTLPNALNPNELTIPIGKIINQSNVLPNMKILIYPYGTDSNLFFYGYVKSLLAATIIGFTKTDIAIYQKALDYVQPLYSEYVVKLLESDTYFPYQTFGKESGVEDTTIDIAY